MQEQERARHMYSGEPEVQFVEKMEIDQQPMQADEDTHEPPLKIVVSNKKSQETDDKRLRMRMYADDENEEQPNISSRVRTERPEATEKKAVRYSSEDDVQPVADLRSKLKSRQRHGFNYLNRPSLSIEIKEEGS